MVLKCIVCVRWLFVLAKAMPRNLGQNRVIDNKAGGGGHSREGELKAREIKNQWGAKD